MAEKLQASTENEEKKMTSASDTLDGSLALAAVGGDRGFLAELAGIFGAASPTLLESMRKSLAAGNLPAAARAARLLRVAAENVAARRVASAALALEAIARQNRPEAMGDAYCALQQEVERLMPVLAEMEDQVACSES